MVRRSRKKAPPAPAKPAQPVTDPVDVLDPPDIDAPVDVADGATFDDAAEAPAVEAPELDAPAIEPPEVEPPVELSPEDAPLPPAAAAVPLPSVFDREAPTGPDEADDLDAPMPARLLAKRAFSFRPGSDLSIARMPGAGSGGTLSLDSHLDSLPPRDEDTEDTPPTAVPGPFELDYEFDDDDDDDDDRAAPAAVEAPVSEDEATTRMDAGELKRIMALAAAAKAESASKPTAPVAVAPVAPAAGMPTWLVILVAAGFLVLGLAAGKLFL